MKRQVTNQESKLPPEELYRLVVLNADRFLDYQLAAMLDAINTALMTVAREAEEDRLDDLAKELARRR